MIAKKKRILITILIVVITILLLGGGTLLYFYITTDILKSEDTLFYKYAMENGKLFDILDVDYLKAYKQKIENTPYKNNTEITFSEQSNDENKDNPLTKLTNNIKIQVQGEADFANGKSHQQIKTLYNVPIQEENKEPTQEYKEMFKVEYVKTQDVYGLISDEVVNKYVSIENNNLPDLINRLGIQEIEAIPEKIDLEKTFAIINLTEQQKLDLTNKYMAVLNREIQKRNYSSEKEVVTKVNGQEVLTNTYTLTLSESQLANVQIKLLEQLNQDQETLKLICAAIQRNETYITSIREKIQEKIEDLKREETTDDFALQIIVYEKERKLVKTEILKPKRTIVIVNNETAERQDITINDETQDVEKITNIWQISRIKAENANTLRVNFSSKENEKEVSKIIIQLKNEGNLQSNNLQTTFDFGINVKNDIRTIKYVDKKEFVDNIEVMELNNSNSVKLNSMTIEENKNLLQAIKIRLEDLYTSKTTSLGLDPVVLKKNIKDLTNVVKDQFNKDEFEKQVQRALNLVKLDIQTDKEIKQQLELAQGDTNKINEIKGNDVVKRLIEFGIKASLETTTNKILIDSGYDYRYTYIIDYENYTITKADS